MNDHERSLVAMVLDGRTEAFESLVGPYRGTLLGMAVRLARDAEDAKEICQETLMRAYQYLGTYDPERSFRNWLLAILVNAARRYGRKRKAAVTLSLPAEDSIHAPAADGPESGHDRAEIRSRLMECLDVLSRREREVFLLRDIEGRSVRETAEILGASSISVRVNLSSARKKIKETIKGKFPELAEGWE